MIATVGHHRASIFALLTLSRLLGMVSGLSTDLARLSSSQCIERLIGLQPQRAIENSLFPSTTVSSSPALHRYLLANPSYFLNDPEFAAAYGVTTFVNEFELCQQLPVIYMTEIHPEYGVLGFQLNSPSGKTMNDLYPAFKYLRSRPIYRGGISQKGSAFYMVHRKQGFPDNRFAVWISSIVMNSNIIQAV